MENNNINNLPKEKFVLVNENKKLHDKELVTKPIGFFKDAMYRFARNKGSIVGAIVIAILVLYSIIAPIFSPYNVSYNDAYYSYILPKLFDNENIDFIDGSKKITTNLTTFIADYAKGVENGHNAIKRQEYKYNADKDMYTYRLDTYQAVGMVFMKSISRSDYYDIQKYQDEKGIQIIYPITDEEKRPKSQKNVNDANFWYETQNIDTSTDLPTNYTINFDGSISFTNIYKSFSVPIMNSASDVNKAVTVKLLSKDDGYVLNYIAKKGSIFEGVTISEDKDLGYLSAKYEREVNSTELVASFDEASKFVFDSTYNTLKVYIGGHENASEDGYYYFGLPASKGSSADLLSESKLGNADNIPFSLYEGSEIVTSIDLNKEYFFSAVRNDSQVTDFFAGSVMNSKFNVATSFTNSAKVQFVTVAGGYKFVVATKTSKIYINAVADGNETTFVQTSNADNALAWTFNSNGTLSINVSGHTDASLDGNYYIAIDGVNKAIVLVNEAQIGVNNVYPLEVVKEGSFTPMTSINDTDTYALHYESTVVNYKPFYIDGEFKGDNYFSKMRIEGEGEYIYDYAIQRNGGSQYEIRVNYYEYYKYYHSQILHDRISKPYFLFGTTSSGQDIFTCLASGARFSFLFAIAVASVNMIVGAIYGAIEGYYGGKADMIMERIVEILSAVPFMIVITLLKYHMGGTSHTIILFISFFLTGWIGMSGLVRMQFYRFKNQEYVLAARTLGAKDPRIMFKHIFPNALGTIVTSSVLVIPGMIFSETSLSYLGIINLNSGNMTSVGTLLAGGQPYLVNYPHMILFPAIFISLLMLCFNLFGNGLRDAFNPSLRGTED